MGEYHVRSGLHHINNLHASENYCVCFCMSVSAFCYLFVIDKHQPCCTSRCDRDKGLVLMTQNYISEVCFASNPNQVV